MIEQNGLTVLSGIERELVLQYLVDGNVPVTLTPFENEIHDKENNSDSVIKSLTSQIFPIAIKGEHVKVKNDGEIFLENPPQSVSNFANHNVKVEFYFNRVGLYFVSYVKETSKGLALSVPDKINRITDEVEEKQYDFSAEIYLDCSTGKELNIKAIPVEDIKLFTRPVWKIIPLEYQKDAKKLLENFVEQAKIEKNAGNGIQLIPVCKYLAEKKVEKMQSLQDRFVPLTILFVDHERFVVGTETKQCIFFPSNEYAVKLSFSINKGPITSREIFVTCKANKIYRSDDGNLSCIDFCYCSMQEEDLRFLYEKATSTLFN